MYSWYPHRLWPYRRNTLDQNFREKQIELPQNFTTYVNDNVANGILNSTESGKPWYRISNEEGNSTSGDVSWGDKVNGEEMASENKTMVAPVMLLSVVLFLYNIGLGSVPYVLISELFSINVSGNFIFFDVLKFYLNRVLGYFKSFVGFACLSPF